MDFFLIVPFYTRWHYTRGTRDVFRNWINYLYFLLDLFALEVVIATFGQQWEVWRKRKNQNAFVSALGRVVHVVAQIVLLVTGFLSLAISMIVGAIFIVLWFLLPIIILFLLALSISKFFS
jgi:hypothetical protein